VRKQVVPIVAALAVVGVFAEVVYAQSADRAIRYRQGVMRAQGWHMGVLGAMAKGERPYDKDTAARSARFVHELVDMFPDGFTPGSESGAPTKAKPDIWKERAKFDKYQQDAKAQTTKLVSAAGTDLAALRTALGATAKACDSCHDDFREK
jgi:cytochrome c556